MTQVLPANAEGMGRAVALLRENQVVAYPTETVYGLAVNPFSGAALDALFSVKLRDRGKPVLMIIGSQAHLAGLAAPPSERARKCMEAFWPGPLSLLLPAAEGLSPLLTGGNAKICVRCPGLGLAREFCDAWGGAITSSSANFSGAEPARTAAAALIPGVAGVLDGGALGDSMPSTVYDPDGDMVLREGPVTPEMLRRVL